MNQFQSLLKIHPNSFHHSLGNPKRKKIAVETVYVPLFTNKIINIKFLTRYAVINLFLSYSPKLALQSHSRDGCLLNYIGKIFKLFNQFYHTLGHLDPVGSGLDVLNGKFIYF